MNTKPVLTKVPIGKREVYLKKNVNPVTKKEQLTLVDTTYVDDVLISDPVEWGDITPEQEFKALNTLYLSDKTTLSEEDLIRLSEVAPLDNPPLVDGEVYYVQSREGWVMRKAPDEEGETRRISHSIATTPVDGFVDTGGFLYKNLYRKALPHEVALIEKLEKEMNIQTTPSLPVVVRGQTWWIDNQLVTVQSVSNTRQVTVNYESILGLYSSVTLHENTLMEHGIQLIDGKYYTVTIDYQTWVYKYSEYNKTQNPANFSEAVCVSNGYTRINGHLYLDHAKVTIREATENEVAYLNQSL